MKTSIFSICMALILFGCSKKEETHRISGILVSDCETMTPVPDMPLEFRYSPKSGLVTRPNRFTYTTTTKADGSFVFEFEENHGLYEMDMNLKGRLLQQPYKILR